MPEVTEGVALPENLSPRYMGHPTPRSKLSQDPTDIIERGGWLEMARRGLYGFDAVTPIRKPSPYVKLARPGRPVFVREFSSDLQRALEGLILPWLDFESLTVIPVEQIVCVQSTIRR